MSFIIGKLSRKVSKQHNEYFVGKVCSLPVRAAWAKKGQDDLCLFLDDDQIKFLSEKNNTEKNKTTGEAVVPEGNKQ